ncbi:unnamed protein product [Microthlaspi erraticum]|uniref:Uncharacterized protein n=1 Tax=Microthlaspi erraticum TaxID=1685480 RepID=A0A6D2KZC6_9BRAS|nr:unnamed protein product [Microthlaspi erraticum]
MESWTNNSDCCYWDGVTCDAKSGEVVELDLSFSCLHGRFQPKSKVFRVQSLRSLDLSNNDLIGQIPWSIGHFSHLTTLDLSKNYFSGCIPSSFGNFSHLTYLSLSENYLDGEIPFSLGKFPHLTSIDLSGNYFSGWISSSIGNLSHLTYLSLYDNSFDGEIPSSLGNFSNLTTIYLSENYFCGLIPSSIGNLSHLTYLNLYRNSFFGEIPSSFGYLNNLAILDVGSNRLGGSFPLTLLNLTKLSFLSLSNNRFTGTLPSSLFTIPFLSTLHLENNQLSGTLEFGNISSSSSKLVELHLGNNNFSGSNDFSILSHIKSLKYLDISHLNTTTTINLHAILAVFNHMQKFSLDLSGNRVLATNKSSVANPPPQLIWGLYLSGCGITEFPMLIRTQHKMEVLDISNNKIEGQVPGWLWTLPNLEQLNLSNNTFTGFEISTQHGLSTVLKPSMRYLYGSYNNFSGNIPSFICDLCSIVALDLSNNNFNGSIPHCMGNLKSSLRFLDIGHNQLVGKLPRSLIRLSTLEVLNVESNIINDTFPFWLSSLPELQVLVLSFNSFHGPIFFSRSNIRSLHVGHNQLVGKLPRSLSNCSFLEVLNVENNRINDTFPFWLESLQRLQELVLHHNEFHGSLHYHPKVASSFPQLRIIGISCNSFSGTLPYDFFMYWSAMSSEGDRSELKYIGENFYYQESLVLMNKGVEMKYTRISTLLTSIDISGNMLRGEIPKSIGLLKYLVVLNLSSNGFSGNIPSSLANLTELESLDLSHNKLSGQIPRALGDLTSLANVTVSHNQLVGLIPQGTQFQTQDASSFEDNLGLCGRPLSKMCGDRDTEESQEPESEEEEDEGALNWTAAAIGLALGVIFGLTVGHIVITQKPHWLVKYFDITSLPFRFVTKQCV